MFHFDRLPDEEKEKVKANMHDKKFLLKIHDKYKLSNYHYSLCCGIDQMVDWYKWGIKEGKI